MALTVGDTINELQRTLREYIEATYHVSHPSLIAQRSALLNRVGIIHQRPFFESTPRYKTSKQFKDIDGLDPAVLEAFEALSNQEGGLSRLVYDPPYDHQWLAVRRALVDKQSMVIMTGTGSGKTEAFLLPILGKLAVEARTHSQSFKRHSGVRAILLYPMNALVNDQLGRLRLIFGDPRIVKKFGNWANRPPRFARYTSRTPYPGLRDPKKDQTRLKPIGDYYVALLERGAPAATLVAELRNRGRWPAKPDLQAWYGQKGSRWQSKTGEYIRCNTLPDDAELLTRHEVIISPPDLLVTNYSMLEYMLMRPLERPIFDRTREWLAENPTESLLLVVDEAHLYRGAAGAEVALLLRRLSRRLDLPANRLQVICTSASFTDAQKAASFGAQLTGKTSTDFSVISGELNMRSPAREGTLEEANHLAQVDLQRFYDAENDPARLDVIETFLRSRGVARDADLGRTLYEALRNHAPLNLLANLTMQTAWPVDELEKRLFPEVTTQTASKAIVALVALGSLAKSSDREPGLLPCRVHAFYRGLPGLWICMDDKCGAIVETWRTGPTGKLFAQPRDICQCGARVLELFTCRSCGTAYARAYTDDVISPSYLWNESGEPFRDDTGNVVELQPLDLLLEEPRTVDVEPADYDLITGRLNPPDLGPRVRTVFLRKDRSRPAVTDEDNGGQPPVGSLGEFKPCGVCGEMASYGRSSVQDHLTKGDQPFQALVVRQLELQPPSPVAPSRLAPHRGRKVLVFSDSRQTAARLAPNIQNYSLQDVLRPLLCFGFATLMKHGFIARNLSINDSYLAVLLAARILDVRLRPELAEGETFDAERVVEEAVGRGALQSPEDLLELMLTVRSSAPPKVLLLGIYRTLIDRFYGLEPLALASIVERVGNRDRLLQLTAIPPIAESDDQKLALVRLWLRCWLRSAVGIWVGGMPLQWMSTEVRPHSGRFTVLKRFIGDNRTYSALERQWLPTLLQVFTEPLGGGKARLKGSEISLLVGGDWSYCQICKTVQRPFPQVFRCVTCGNEEVRSIDPAKDPVFRARKGYYRTSAVNVLRSPPAPPMAIIAAEHTAQLNAAQVEEIYSKAEEHELLFQDVDLGPDERGRDRPAIDILSCTTTMEVGIDIGTLSGVALRNMPPSRASYQQRAGRAGRRGNAAATVIALASADSHDAHHFEQPDQIVRGKVVDPNLTLNNYDIVRRHVTAFLLQRYYGTRLPLLPTEDLRPQLFDVLGTVAEFTRPDSVLNRDDFGRWLEDSVAELRDDLQEWLPKELSAKEREQLLANLVPETLSLIDGALVDSEPSPTRTAH